MEEVARLQAAAAGSHDCSGSKVPSTDTQRVSDRAGGPGEDVQRDRPGLSEKSLPLGQLTNWGAGLA